MEEYKKLLEQLSGTPAGKPSRELHKKLKKYGDGLEFGRRYPKFDTYLARTAFAVSIITLILKILGE